MSALRFRVLTAAGQQVVGPVQGCGGVLNGRGALGLLLGQVERASAGEPLHVFEPVAGHCCMYPEYCAFDSGPPVYVPLAGATVELLPDDESERIACAANEHYLYENPETISYAP